MRFPRGITVHRHAVVPNGDHLAAKTRGGSRRAMPLASAGEPRPESSERRVSLEAKLRTLRRNLRKTDGLVIGFSGGTDSTFLAAVAKQELGSRVVAVTAVSPIHPRREQREARILARGLGLHHRTIRMDERSIPGFARNPKDRCYHCKRAVFRRLQAVARAYGIQTVADGTNADDLRDFRPGRRALRELGIVSPLLEVRLTKQEIRRLSRHMGLPTADKPPMACLASRIPYGTPITRAKLKAVDDVEQGLRRMGFAQVRVRHHGDIARIEVAPQDIPRLAAPGLRERAVRLARKAGFLYVTLDLEGYRTGSLNAVK